MPELGCPPTMTSNKPLSRIGVLPTPKNAFGTLKSAAVSRCQTGLPVSNSRQVSFPSAPKV